MTLKKKALSNYISALSLILMGYFIYAFNPFFSIFFHRQYSIFNMQITEKDLLLIIVILYAIFLFPYYLTLPKYYQTKSTIVWNLILQFRKKGSFDYERTALLSVFIKLIFLPLMIILFARHIYILSNFLIPYALEIPDFRIFYFLFFHLLCAIDVFCFILGYGTEHPKLKNEIVSVDKTFLGWFLCLICYPPLNYFSNKLVGWYTVDFPNLNFMGLTYILSVVSLILITIYVWASISLNFKASNLTNRGIVASGPYAFVRHPAYISKIFFWWVGAIPVFIEQLTIDYLALFLSILSMIIWTFIYWGRALTEEKHLINDSSYKDYCKIVKYKFIPFIL